nr:MAG TPA: hypothetical protein [Caudoviricetes sp.]
MSPAQAASRHSQGPSVPSQRVLLSNGRSRRGLQAFHR